MFIKTILALSVATLVLAAPSPQGPPGPPGPPGPGLINADVGAITNANVLGDSIGNTPSNNLGDPGSPISNIGSVVTRPGRGRAVDTA
ncbi:hypothetical protein BC826DRAFT_1102569 [Russula brevipes]|nr:hypothetical protein BC826DRAFT_1102569 [Russula brevipes]